ncbi:ABC transporter permease [Pseudaminobacter arsenicus]|uniref:ABC transporter permease n=1 Tax=Borborobacter arsenicus TaxID=1851146 RepID=A0A432V4R4_9HYPH|nr:ABC transporter permease [Pseudaminobacter arsenicus]RUM97110.1 ABC transporter permease [Pseudaminobacter arsenicus]
MNAQKTNHASFLSRLGDAALPLGIVVALLAIWEAAVHLLQIQPFVLPAPTEIFKELMISGPTVILPQLHVTMAETMAGYLAAIVVAAVLSVLILYSSAFRRGVLPLVVASQTIPIITMAPVLVIWFGYNSLPRIIITAIVAFFPLTIAAVTGLKSLEPHFIDFFRSLNATPAQIFFKLRLPVALPSIFGGLKVAATLAVIGATISEWVGASQGIGYLIAQDTALLNTTRVFASLTVLGIAGMALFGLVGLIERLSMPWIYARPTMAWLRAQRSPQSPAAAVARPRQ